MTIDPLALFVGRLSGNLEVNLAAHHAVVVSANALVFQESRGSPRAVISQGLGFASSTSSSVGVEIGYHYWWQARRSLRGPFFGPSLMLGSTSEATVGDPSHAQTYGGLAFDVGEQDVLAGGFTIGGGLGLGFLRMADSTAVFPRLLFQIGWSL